MGPRTGPRPASSTPKAHGAAVDGSDASVGRSEGGIGEKYVDEAPDRSSRLEMDGGRKMAEGFGGVSRAIWESVCG